MLKAPAYVIISMVFFILIGVGMAYSYFFYPNNHPIDCIVKSYTGKDCPTCGFSRSFSFYTHFDLQQGIAANALSWPVFLFFAFQFFVRGLIVFYYYFVGKNFKLSIIIGDSIISISFFLFAFLPLINQN
jgi:hypothetical protein